MRLRARAVSAPARGLAYLAREGILGEGKVLETRTGGVK